jgi:DNA transposition AAA+ family ATPase
MKKVFARTSNVNNFVAAMNRLRNCGDEIPRMALVYGKYGTGRTKTALWYLAQHPEAIFIRTLKLMTGHWLLAKIVAELGEEPAGYTAKLWDQLVGCLLERPRILFFDEVDYLCADPRVIETLRDIHDVTGTPIVFIGMEHADNKLKRFKHLWDRFSEILKFEEFNEADLATIADTLCDVKITPDAIRYLYINCEARRFRPLIIQLYKAEAIARANSLKEITAQHLQGVRK